MDGWTAVLIIILVGVVLFIYVATDDKRKIKKIESGEIKVEDSFPITASETTIKNGTHTVTSVELVKVKKGTVTGVIGTILTALLWLLYFLTGGITVIQTAMLNGYTLTAAAALVSIFGICFHDASCMLLAAIALVGAVIVDWSTLLGLIPAVLLMVSHVQMKKRYGLEVTEKEE